MKLHSYGPDHLLFIIIIKGMTFVIGRVSSFGELKFLNGPDLSKIGKNDLQIVIIRIYFQISLEYYLAQNVQSEAVNSSF